MENLSIKKKVGMILEELHKFSNFNEEVTSVEEFHPIHTYKLTTAIGLNEKITFIIPAFPAKSANREKTLSSFPDMGEVQSLKHLNDFAKRVSKIHEGGAEVLICSDGRVFSDLVGVKEDDVSLYREELKAIVALYQFENIRFFDLEDKYDSKLSFDQMRFHLEKQFSKTEESLRDEVKSDSEIRTLFNGIHRFLKEDFTNIIENKSKNQIHKMAKERAYKVVLRSNAWSALVERMFPHAFRLSIHPQSLSSLKFPVKLLPGEEKWGTPWHRVPVLVNNNFCLMRHHDALKAGAILKDSNGHAFFEIRSA